MTRRAVAVLCCCVAAAAAAAAEGGADDEAAWFAEHYGGTAMRPIPRVDARAGDFTLGRFKQQHMDARVPVIIDGYYDDDGIADGAPRRDVPIGDESAAQYFSDYAAQWRGRGIDDLTKWDLARVTAACGAAPLEFANHHLAYISSVKDGAEKAAFEARVRSLFNVTAAQVLLAMRSSKPGAEDEDDGGGGGGGAPLSMRDFVRYFFREGADGVDANSGDGSAPPPPLPAALAARLGKFAPLLRAARAARWLRRSGAIAPERAHDYSHLADYSLPLNLHSFEVKHASCPALAAALAVPPPVIITARLMRPLAALGVSQEDVEAMVRGLTHLFVAPRGSRAYPAHQHGIPNESFMLMLQGRKHYAMWAQAEAPLHGDADYTAKMTGAAPSSNLYPAKTSGVSEVGAHGDTVLMAEGIRPDLRRQPRLARAAGWAGRVGRGSLIYIPCGVAHQVENVDDAMALAWHVDALERCRTPEQDRAHDRAVARGVRARRAAAAASALAAAAAAAQEQEEEEEEDAVAAAAAAAAGGPRKGEEEEEQRAALQVGVARRDGEGADSPVVLGALDLLLRGFYQAAHGGGKAGSAQAAPPTLGAVSLRVLDGGTFIYEGGINGQLKLGPPSPSLAGGGGGPSGAEVAAWIGALPVGQGREVPVDLVIMAVFDVLAKKYVPWVLATGAKANKAGLHVLGAPVTVMGTVVLGERSVMGPLKSVQLAFDVRCLTRGADVGTPCTRPSALAAAAAAAAGEASPPWLRFGDFKLMNSVDISTDIAGADADDRASDGAPDEDDERDDEPDEL